MSMIEKRQKPGRDAKIAADERRTGLERSCRRVNKPFALQRVGFRPQPLVARRLDP
ncbi:hypothetical protein [Jiella flava]|uniref:Uncharacterized protein n=1 Tax=Jiella flava TaxID=2816857 RepID=A0A939FYL3_9HYPH|nr:hypothetical protein [Jiella flava]MBO0663945.1 hypothetical protein [Jiella flava]